MTPPLKRPVGNALRIVGFASLCAVIGCESSTRSSQAGPESAARAAPGSAFLDNLDYPRVTVMTVLNEFSSAPNFDELERAIAHGRLPPRPLDAIPAGSSPAAGVVIGSQRGEAAERPDWAALAPTDRVLSLYDAFRAQAGFRHIASPASLLTPRRWTTIGPDSTDKAGLTVGSRFEVRAEPSGGSVALTVRWSRTDSSAIAATDALTIPVGYALAVVIAPRLAGEAWRSAVITPDVVHGPGEYPVQTSSGFEPAP